jgi:hypothetical protein
MVRRESVRVTARRKRGEMIYNAAALVRHCNACDATAPASIDMYAKGTSTRTVNRHNTIPKTKSKTANDKYQTVPFLK